MKRLIALSLLLLPLFAFADDDSGNSLSDTISLFVDFVTDGIYESADTILERIAAWYIIWNLELKIFWLELAVNMAEGMVDSLGLSDAINSAFSSLDSSVTGVIFYLKIPDALNMIISARVARMILDVL